MMHRVNPTNRNVCTLAKLLLAVGITAVTAVMARAGTCYVDVGTDQQTIDGFGFSSAWSGQLSNAKNNALYNTLGMSLLRIRIDPNSYWGDETANAAAAHAVGVTVLGTPWSPPASMKDNSSTVHGSLRTDQYANYASYLRNAASSIGLDYVSIQNEPDWDPDYEGCTWTPNQFLVFCRDYAQHIGKPVVMPESLSFNDDYSDPTLNDATAASHISVAAGHFYGNGNYVHRNAINKGKHVWMTEHYIENTQTSMANCITIAKEISDAMNNQFNAYFWWWVADYDSSVNLVYSDGTIYKNGYTIGQFAKWIRPGYVRCSSTYNPTSSVYVTAYHTSSNLVLVAVNTSSSSVNQPFAVQSASVSTLSAYRTSGSENMAGLGSVSVSGNSFSYALPAQSVTTFVGQIQSGSGPANGTYRLIARHSGKAMEAAGFGTSNGTQIQQWTYYGYSSQKWTLTGRGSGNYSLIGVGSGKALDIYARNSANGTKVELWDYSGGSNQLFKLTATDSGYYRITPNCATGSALDVDGVSTADGAKVQLWSWTGGSNQQWALQADAPANGTYKIIARNSGKAMEASGFGTSNGTQIQQWTYYGYSSQQWTLTDTGSGNYKLIGVGSGKSLDIDYSSGGTANGTKVELWDYWAGPSQLYKLTATDSGYYRITPNCATGSCLDVDGVSTADGAKVQLWNWTGGSNQQWSFQAP